MKSGVEHRDLRRARHGVLGRFNGLQLQPVVFGGELHVLANLRLHLRRNAGGLLERVPAVNHAVPHRSHFIRACDGLVRPAPQHVQDGLQDIRRRSHPTSDSTRSPPEARTRISAFPGCRPQSADASQSAGVGEEGKPPSSSRRVALRVLDPPFRDQDLHGSRYRGWCPGRELNPHSRFREEDFKSSASADFATRARSKQTSYWIIPTFACSTVGEFVGTRITFMAVSRSNGDSTAFRYGCMYRCDIVTVECPMRRMIVKTSAPDSPRRVPKVCRNECSTKLEGMRFKFFPWVHRRATRQETTKGAKSYKSGPPRAGQPAERRNLYRPHPRGAILDQFSIVGGAIC